MRDGGFESFFLQRGVQCEPDFLAFDQAIGEKPRTLAAVCGWLGT
jgi:hypothetical protein